MSYIDGNGDHICPANSNGIGNIQELSKQYEVGQDLNGRRSSSQQGIPKLLGGANVSSIRPKAWVGANSIYTLSAIDTGSIGAKVGSGSLTVRGGSVIADKQVQIFPNDPPQVPTTDMEQYMFNKGNTPAFGTNFDLPMMGNSVYVSSIGDDLQVTEAPASISSDFERSIRFCPDTIAPASRVFVFAKGHTNESSCEVAISYDATNIYRTIGGTDVIVGATSLLSTTIENRLCIINKSGADWFIINNTIVRDGLTNNRGAFTTTRLETLGGILGSDSDGVATIDNALGHYRQFDRYGSDRLLNKYIIAEQQTASYANYTTSILIGGIGDSVGNGFGGTGYDRINGHYFQLETYFKSLGYDVLFANGALGGTHYVQCAFTEIPKPASYASTVTLNTNNFNTAIMMCKKYRVDMLLSNSGTNEYTNQSEDEGTFNWLEQIQAMQDINATCSRYGVPSLQNTCGINSASTTNPYLKTLYKDVRDNIIMAGSNLIDWSNAFLNPDTGVAYPDMLLDDAHPSTLGYTIMRDMHIPYMFGLIHSTRFTYPETA